MNKKERYCTCASILALALVASVGMAAQPSFTGKWTLNLQKSQLTGQTFSIEKTASNTIHWEMQGFGYDFNPDGKEYPVPDGSTVVVLPTGPDTWDFTLSMHGKVTMTVHIAAQGDSQTDVMRVIKPDGSTVEQTSTATRVSGGPGLLGKWKSTEVKGAPTSMVIATKRKKGVTISYPEFQQVCKGRFDGKDHTVTMAGAATKMTFVFEKTGANTLKVTTKLQGKLFYVDVLTLSEDGKTLTDEGNPVAANEPIKAVYERE